MKTDFLIFGRDDDDHISEVVKKLTQKHFKCLVISSQNLLAASGKLLFCHSGSSLQIQIDGSTLDLNEVRGFWSRRIASEIPSEYALDDATRVWLEQEHKFALTGIVSVLYETTKESSKWINAPLSDLKAELKLLQLFKAANYSSAWSVPKSVVSNSSQMINMYIQQSLKNQNFITKPIYKGFYRKLDQYELFYTSDITQILTDNNYVPELDKNYNYIQEYINKKYEVRATIIGSKVFSVAIYSQESKIANIDWRHYDINNTPHKIIDLPDIIHQACINYVRDLGLIFGAIDFIVDHNDQFHFLEINSKGQWLWLEDLTGVQITDAIVQYFCNETL